VRTSNFLIFSRAIFTPFLAQFMPAGSTIRQRDDQSTIDASRAGKTRMLMAATTFALAAFRVADDS
jgi:hypothetical protein